MSVAFDPKGFGERRERSEWGEENILSSSCNFVPSLFLHFDVADIAGLVAPRPLVIQSAREDHLAGERGLENVLEPMEELKKVYSLLGAENRICHHIVGGPHHFEKEGIMEAIDSVCLH